MSAVASQITSLTIVYSTVYSGAAQRKHQSFVWLAFVGGIQRWLVNYPRKGPVTREMFPFDDVIMKWTLKCRLQTRDPVVSENVLQNLKQHFVISFHFTETSLCSSSWPEVMIGPGDSFAVNK